MNTLQHLTITFLLCLGLSHSATAQDILSPEEKQAVIANVNQFLIDINLSEMDKPAFRAILGDFFIGVVAIGATNYSPKTNRKILKTLIKERDARVKDLLYQEQYKVYKARIKERRQNLEAYLQEPG